MNIGKKSYEKILENLIEGLYLVNRDRVITYWNKAAEEISGFSAEEVVGKSCADSVLTHVDAMGNSLCHCGCPLAVSISDGHYHSNEIFLHHKKGQRIPVTVRAIPLLDDDGTRIGAVEIFTDNRSLATSESRVRELEAIAFIDELTRLANRRSIVKELDMRLAEQERYEMPFGVLLMDIDNFKKVNDTFGHDVGDSVLKYVARTLVGYSRPFDFYGRWGGEEFIGIIRNFNSENALVEHAERLRKLIESAYIFQGDTRISVTISMGATLSKPTDTIDSIVKRSDTLLYQSKAAGRNCVTSG